MRAPTRLTRLEQVYRQPRAPGHFTGVVRVPHDIPHDAWEAWLASQPCACHQRFCPQRRVGVLLPAKCASSTEWEAHYGR